MKKISAVLLALLLCFSCISFAEETDGYQLLAGAAIRDITPAEEWLPLTGVAKTVMVGVIDPIHVRAIALSDGETTALIMTFEMSGVPAPDVYLPILSEHTGIPVEAIYYNATHSHSSPSASSDPADLEIAVDSEEITGLQLYSQFVLQQMLDCADEALANMEPAKVGIGYTNSYINVNRSADFYDEETGEVYVSQGYNPTGFSDKTLALVCFDTMDGEHIAMIVHYSMHNTAMYNNQYSEDGVGISPDIGGYVSSCIESYFPGTVGIWMAGTSGDQNPILSNEYFTPNIETGQQEATMMSRAVNELVTFYGKVQFADVKKALASIEDWTSEAKISYAYGGTTVPTEDGGEFGFQLKLLRIGDIAFVGNPAELFNSIGVYMRENSLLKDTLVSNNNRTYTTEYTQYTNYIPDDDAIERGYRRNTTYKTGYVKEALTELMNELITSTDVE